MPKYTAIVIIETDQPDLENTIHKDLCFLIETSLDVHREMSDEPEFKSIGNIVSINVEEIKRI